MLKKRVASVLVIISAFAAASAYADNDDHVVINIVNGYVYVSLGTRDGAAEGDRLELLDDDAAFGVLELDLCGEVICRAPLGKALAGRVMRGMSVRLPKKAKPTKAKAEPAPVAKPKPASPTSAATPRGAAPSSSDAEPFVGPDVLPYRSPIPRGYQVERKPYSALVTVGWIGMSVSYGITALAGLDTEGGAALLLPVIGPLIYVANAPDFQQVEAGPYVVSALLQGASLLALIGGYSGERQLVRIGSKPTVSFAPVLTRDGGYLGVVGRF